MMKRPPNLTTDHENGYVMITALWMLLLGASIVALLMLRNLQHSEELSFDIREVQMNDTMESTLETVIADIAFNGSDSKFALLPAQNQYEIHGETLNVTVSNENGKIDINQADSALMNRALQGLGISSLSREAFVRTAQQRLTAKQPFQSITDVETLFERAGVNINEAFCPEQFFTVHSGQARPQTGQMDARLARALGEASLSKQERFRAGNALRIEIRTKMGSPLIALVRTSGQLDRSHIVLDWRRNGGC